MVLAPWPWREVRAPGDGSALSGVEGMGASGFVLGDQEAEGHHVPGVAGA